MFEIGMKVVCVDAVPRAIYHPHGLAGNGDMNGLAEGAIYTIRAVPFAKRAVKLYLAEITRPPCQFLDAEAPFDARRFRPVVEPKTSIAIFEAMLLEAILHRAPVDPAPVDLRKLLGVE